MESIEYKKGYKNFLGCKIDLRFRPFIPRKETEFWVKEAIQDINLSRAKSRESLSILDIFSGSGCIGISILKHTKNSQMIFAEIDKKFIRQIKLNLKINKINSRRYKVIQSDIFKNVTGIFDYIFANPPYVALKNKHLVQKSVLDFEPHKALFGGEDGLLLIRKFLKDARKYLKGGGLPAACLSGRQGRQGKIYMEFDHLQKKELEKLLKKLNYKNYKIHKDQFKKYRWLIAK
ncbi:MAG TPA: HemK family protein methyltransferase [Candidatus Paceibacterota bacterium]|nr:HemK family protein methyltransferase [Candidatus Paceibacterota bacterium]